MDSEVIIALAALGVAVVIVFVVIYRWSTERSHLLNGIRAEARAKLRQKYSEDQVTKITQLLENFTKPKPLQLAADLYLRYDDPDTLTTSVAAIGTDPSESMMSRTRRLMVKYDDQETFQMILHNEVWKGQSEDELIDSLGTPSAVEESMLDSKDQEVWKYDPIGEHAFRKSITLQNTEVVSWEFRDS